MNQNAILENAFAHHFLKPWEIITKVLKKQ